VEAFFTALKARHRDARALAGIRVAVVGAETARALAAHGVEADLVPADSRAEGLAEALLEAGIADQHVLLAQAAGARRALPERLAEAGVQMTAVPVYRTVAPEPEEVDLSPLDGGPVDYATFTSASTVHHLEAVLGGERFRRVLDGCRIAAIGPITARALEERGLTVHVQPPGPAVAQLVAALCADAKGGAAAEPDIVQDPEEPK